MFFRKTCHVGNNGFTDFKFILSRTATAAQPLLPPRSCSARYVCRWLTKTKFGLVQRAVRDSETRVLFSGTRRRTTCSVWVLARRSPLGSALRAAVGIIAQRNDAGKVARGRRVGAVGGRGTLIGPIIERSG
jgi:urea transport system permease protein